MLSAENNIGCLLEIRFMSPFALGEVDVFVGQVRTIVKSAANPLVAISDLRQSTVLQPEAATKLIGLLKSDNPRIARNAAITSPGDNTISMQIARIFREANNPNRRLFTDVNEASTWLCEVLDSEEQLRLLSFLNQATPFR